MKRISAYIEEELYSKVAEIADRDSRSFNQTLQMLLQQAVKERERQRLKKQAKKV